MFCHHQSRVILSIRTRKTRDFFLCAYFLVLFIKDQNIQNIQNKEKRFYKFCRFYSVKEEKLSLVVQVVFNKKSVSIRSIRVRYKQNTQNKEKRFYQFCRFYSVKDKSVFISVICGKRKYHVFREQEKWKGLRVK